LLVLGPPYLLLVLVAAYVASQLNRLANVPRVRSKITPEPSRAQSTALELEACRKVTTRGRGDGA
jgi:hypothetical protein